MFFFLFYLVQSFFFVVFFHSYQKLSALNAALDLLSQEKKNITRLRYDKEKCIS